MINKVKLGKTVAYKNNSGSVIPSGAIVLFGRIPGICVAPIYPYQTGVLDISGGEYCFSIPALESAVSFGSAVYVNDGSASYTGNDFSYSEGAGKTHIGRVTRAAKIGDVKLYVACKYAEGKYQSGGGGGEENVIEIVKVNNVALPVDAQKAVNVDLTDYATLDDLNDYATSASLLAHTGDNAIHVPDNGSVGQILKKTADGSEWGDAPSSSSVWGGITGTLSDQTDLNSALEGKANASHTHTKAQITDFAHTHAISDVNTLQSELDALASAPAVTAVSATATIQPGQAVKMVIPASGSGTLSASGWTSTKAEVARIRLEINAGATLTTDSTLELMGTIDANSIYDLYIDGMDNVKPKVYAEKIGTLTPPRDGTSVATAWLWITDATAQGDFALTDSNKKLHSNNLTSTYYVKANVSANTNCGTDDWSGWTVDYSTNNGSTWNSMSGDDYFSFGSSAVTVIFRIRTTLGGIQGFTLTPAPNAE